MSFLFSVYDPLGRHSEGLDADVYAPAANGGSEPLYQISALQLVSALPISSEQFDDRDYCFCGAINAVLHRRLLRHLFIQPTKGTLL